MLCRYSGSHSYGEGISEDHRFGLKVKEKKAPLSALKRGGYLRPGHRHTQFPGDDYLSQRYGDISGNRDCRKVALHIIPEVDVSVPILYLTGSRKKVAYSFYRAFLAVGAIGF